MEIWGSQIKNLTACWPFGVEDFNMVVHRLLILGLWFEAQFLRQQLFLQVLQSDNIIGLGCFLFIFIFCWKKGGWGRLVCEEENQQLSLEENVCWRLRLVAVIPLRFRGILSLNVGINFERMPTIGYLTSQSCCHQET